MRINSRQAQRNGPVMTPRLQRDKSRIAVARQGVLQRGHGRFGGHGRGRVGGCGLIPNGHNGIGLVFPNTIIGKGISMGHDIGSHGGNFGRINGPYLQRPRDF